MSGVATREAYGKALVELGKLHEDMVVLDADLANATKTQYFKDAFPDRFVDCGIAEADMTGIAAGLATCGKVPFMSSFAMFAAGRNYEQVRNSIGYPHPNVKIGATHAGISVGEDGATHQCLEDLALMREIPGMTVMCPADDIEAKAMVFAAYEHEGPVFMRFSRFGVEPVHDENNINFQIGKGEVLRNGTDLTIIATGLPVRAALDAANALAADGLDIRVINMPTIKPIDADLVKKAAAETKRIVTVEEHWIAGGLGSAVLETIAENPVPVYRHGINDVFGESGPAAELLAKYGLDAEGIAKFVKEHVK